MGATGRRAGHATMSFCAPTRFTDFLSRIETWRSKPRSTRGSSFRHGAHRIRFGVGDLEDGVNSLDLDPKLQRRSDASPDLALEYPATSVPRPQLSMKVTFLRSKTNCFLPAASSSFIFSRSVRGSSPSTIRPSNASTVTPSTSRSVIFRGMFILPLLYGIDC